MKINGTTSQNEPFKTLAANIHRVTLIEIRWCYCIFALFWVPFVNSYAKFGDRLFSSNFGLFRLNSADDSTFENIELDNGKEWKKCVETVFLLGFVPKDVIMKGFWSDLSKRSKDNVLFREFHKWSTINWLFECYTEERMTYHSERFIRMEQNECNPSFMILSFSRLKISIRKSVVTSVEMLWTNKCRLVKLIPSSLTPHKNHIFRSVHLLLFMMMFIFRCNEKLAQKKTFIHRYLWNGIPKWAAAAIPK